MPNEELNALQTAVHELREAVEKKNKDVLDVAKAEKIKEEVLSLESKNQELVKSLELQKKSTEEAIERLEALEAKAARLPSGSEQKQTAELEAKAYTSFLTKGKEALSPEELKYLRTDVGADGGVLVSDESFGEIVKNVTEISPIRSVARVRTIGRSRGLEVEKRSSLVTSYWVGEGDTATQSNSQYAQETIKLEKLMAESAITIEALEDASYNMEREINLDVAESIAQKEGAAFVSGKGAAFNQPTGVMTDDGISIVNTGSATALTMDSILKLTGQIKTSLYEPIFAMNRRTIVEVMLLKDSNGQYLWQAGNIAGGVAPTLAGYRYLEVPDMDDVAANAYPILFGDFRRGYVIVDRAGITVTRDPYTLANQGKVKFTFVKRTGGGVVKTESFVKLKVAA